MKLIKKVLMIIALFISPFFLSSCWDYRDTKDLSIVAGMAIDRNLENDKLALTVEIIKLASGEHESKLSSELIEIEGDTIFDASRNAISKVGKKLYWGHAKTVIISEQIAKEGVDQVIDWISRDSEMRSEMFFLVSKEDTAKDIFIKSSKTSGVKSFNIADCIVNQKNLSKAEYNKEVGLTKQFLQDKYINLTLPIIRLDKNNDKLLPFVSGSAVFKGSNLTGYINGDETRNLLLIRNSLKGGLIPLKNPLDKSADVTLEIYGNNTKIKSIYDAGKITMTINIEPEVAIGEISKSVNFIDSKKQEDLKTAVDEKIKKDVRALIEKVQRSSYGDIFDFAKIIEMQMPRLWKSIENNWGEEFQDLNVIVNVDTHIKGSGRTSKPIKVGK